MINSKRILKTGVLAVMMTIVFAIFAFRAAEWTQGLSSEFLVYGAASSSGGGTTGGGGGTTGGGTTTKVVPQIAAGAYGPGAHYATIIEVVNPNSSPITLSGNFYNEDGTPSTLTYATNVGSQPTFSGSFSNLNVPASAIVVISVGLSTATTPATGTTNWGIFTGSNAISVSAFYELRHSGDEALYSRVGVPSSRPDMTSFVIPRIREKVSTTQAAEIETGYAIVNTGSVTATITAKLIDVNGNTVATLSFPLAKNKHRVGITYLDFNFLNPESAGRQYNYMLFTSDQPTIAAAALAFEGGSLTSFPVDALQ